MTGHWGLECNNHGSHGVCSNNVDSLHSAGIGAMTGKIDLFYGGGSAKRDCPDDHNTCFRGPADGEWGNVCNCDSWHSQLRPRVLVHRGLLLGLPRVVLRFKSVLERVQLKAVGRPNGSSAATANLPG